MARTRAASSHRAHLGWAAPESGAEPGQPPRTGAGRRFKVASNGHTAAGDGTQTRKLHFRSHWILFAAVVALGAVSLSALSSVVRLPSSAALSAPVCALRTRLPTKLGAWVPQLERGLQRVCTALATAHQKKFPDYEPHLRAWRARARPTFVRTSAVVALVIIPIARYVLDLGFQALGRRLLPVFSPAEKPDELLFTKWREACWRLTHYAGLAALGVLSTMGEPWMADTPLLWRGWPHEHVHTPALVYWYSIEFGLYLYALADLLLWEATRGDYYAMILHHVATLALLAASFHYSFLRAGCILLMLNDFVDLWFEGAKLAKYAAAENVSTAFFLAFVASWAWLRQVYAPFELIPSLARDGWELVETYGPDVRHVTILSAFLSMVALLVGLHTYWFVFLCQKIKVSVSIHVSIKVVDRRPNAVAPAYSEALMRAAAGSPQRQQEQQQRMSVPTGLDAHTDDTLLEED